jgi:hypothetical protein
VRLIGWTVQWKWDQLPGDTPGFIQLQGAEGERLTIRLGLFKVTDRSPLSRTDEHSEIYAKTVEVFDNTAAESILLHRHVDDFLEGYEIPARCRVDMGLLLETTPLTVYGDPISVLSGNQYLTFIVLPNRDMEQWTSIL